MPAPSLFCDWLSRLGVAHTRAYSDARFRRMTFHSLYGLGKLMQDYGVDTTGVSLADKSEIAELPAPFVAQMQSGDMAIVLSAGGGTVRYLTEGTEQTMPADKFADAWTGVALLAQPCSCAREPHYGRHRFAEIMTRLRDIGLWLCIAAVFVYLFITHGLEGRWYAVVVALLDIGGLTLSFMLVQKTAGVRTGLSDRVCGVLEKGGCDDILATRASTFLGIFHWSEVGLAYFGVSLASLLLFPARIHDLALVNVCCLPYTVWSISYQRFVAHRWCTMCVGVQATLWLLFFAYLGGGCLHGAWPPHLSFFALGAVYVAALLLLNKYSRLLKYAYYDTDASDTGDSTDTAA